MGPPQPEIDWESESSNGGATSGYQSYAWYCTLCPASRSTGTTHSLHRPALATRMARRAGTGLLAATSTGYCAMR